MILLSFLYLSLSGCQKCLEGTGGCEEEGSEDYYSYECVERDYDDKSICHSWGWVERTRWKCEEFEPPCIPIEE